MLLRLRVFLDNCAVSMVVRHTNTNAGSREGGEKGEGYSLYVIISRYMYHASLKGTVFGPVWSGLGKVIHLS